MSETATPAKKRTRGPNKPKVVSPFAPQVIAEGVDSSGRKIAVEAHEYTRSGDTHIFTRHRDGFVEREFITAPRRLVVKEPYRAPAAPAYGTSITYGGTFPVTYTNGVSVPPLAEPQQGTGGPRLVTNLAPPQERLQTQEELVQRAARGNGVAVGMTDS